MDSVVPFSSSPLNGYLSPDFSPKPLFEHEFELQQQQMSKPIVFGGEYGLFPPSPPHCHDDRSGSITITPSQLHSEASSVKYEDDDFEAMNKRKHSLPPKKRKSWGQELPTPTTNLPPRKRAKTAEEKEQRRIERVLRNRHAAQMSRERKRLEYEHLEAENDYLKNAIKNFYQVIKDMHSERQSFGAEVYESCKTYVPPTLLPKLVRPSPIPMPAELPDFTPFRDPFSPESQHEFVDGNITPIEPKSPASHGIPEAHVKVEIVDPHHPPVMMDEMHCRSMNASMSSSIDYDPMMSWSFMTMPDNQGPSCHQQMYNNINEWQTGLIASPGLVLI